MHQLEQFQRMEAYALIKDASLAISTIGIKKITLSTWADELTTEQFTRIKTLFGPLKYHTTGTSDNKRAEGTHYVDGMTLFITVYGAMNCKPVEIDSEEGPTDSQINTAIQGLKDGTLKLTDCQPHATKRTDQICTVLYCCDTKHEAGLCIDHYLEAQKDLAQETVPV